jgi:hypothetical protein
MLKVITPAATNDLTVLDTLRAELGIEGPAQDVTLSGLIRQASDTIASFCGLKTFGRQRVLQTVQSLGSWHRMGGGIVLDLDIEPTIHAVTEAGVALTTVDFTEDGGILYRRDPLSAVFITGWVGTPITIEYSAGYELLGNLPADIERCAVDLCAHFYHSRGRDPTLRQERILDVIESRWQPVTGGIPEGIAERLRPYQKARVS